MTDWDQVTQAYAQTVALCGRDIDARTAALAVRVVQLAGLTADEAMQALLQHMQDPDRGRFAPRPADIIAQARGDRRDLEDEAALAFGRLRDAVRKIGAYRSLVVGCDRTAAGLRAIGGWQELCRATADDWPSMQAQFRRAYCAAPRQDGPHVFGGVGGYGEAVELETGDRMPVAELPQRRSGSRQLGDELRKIRDRYLARGGETLCEDDILREVAARRAGSECAS